LVDDWEAVIKQVKEASDIVDVVGTYVTLRQTGKTSKGLCPFHQDHHPSFDVDPQRQRYRCWACGKHGDVISFIQEFEHVEFREALEILARRAGISLEKTVKSGQNLGRARMFEVMKWAAEQFHQCLLDSPLAEAARVYLGERRLSGETIRRFKLGFAPREGDWLVRLAARSALSSDTLETVGLIARRAEGDGWYDRFRDRVMFPIRDPRGQTVGFGGRILPSSPLSAKAPKYYNSSDTPLFTKSEQLYGLDMARQEGAGAGFLAVVEGYTDVLMAHQMGIPQVVSTMGTALNARHVHHLRRYVPRVVLVFDADAGGDTGVDRALEIFVSQEVDLAIATLPDGMDPCDLLVQAGAEPFRLALDRAVNALDFKLDRVLARSEAQGIEGRRRAVDEVLGIIALAHQMPDQAGAVKQELVVSRIAQRLSLREETIWARLKELRAKRPSLNRPAGKPMPQERKAPAAPWEQQLLQVLLSDPALVSKAVSEITPEEIEHPGLRLLLQRLFALHAQGTRPDFDRLRDQIENGPLLETALRFQEIGRRMTDRPARLNELLAEFHKRQAMPVTEKLQNQLKAASDHTEGVELLRQLQQRTLGLESGASPVGGPGS
jgi:DNA primase